MTTSIPHPGDATRPLVTVLGATGFVGSAVMARLSRRDFRLRAVARRPLEPPIAGSAELETISVDITEAGALASAVEGSDVIVHLLLCEGGWRAAGEPGGERVNVGVMRELVDICRSSQGPAPVVVYAGAASQVGVPPREPLDGTEADRPATVYDQQKVVAERLLLDATEAGWMRGVSLRLPTIFGASPGAADRGVVAAMVRRAHAGEALTMWHDGSVRRDLVDVSDIAVAFEAAVDHADRLAGASWLVGAGDGVPLGEVFGMIARAVSERTGSPPVPVVSVEPPEHAPETDFRSVTIDATAFRAVTGWQPRMALRDGIDRLAADEVRHACRGYHAKRGAA
ncbi:NAD-dependent epimerase/dehydratase family protein [Phytoactinopolyspora mesophila]|uniref:NAD-dependent epimerase/dehydratase family protein n=1 Tax=Phytoactinopolyspora mesophila TaxID=2650750 RepID=A0A7K3M0Q5_9ACTN|nr:NAD-dependent epimerase/dehydratase family protein [Phytoactinopolyspora mesophila]NDL56885.1 NAD-dependent epimerase/dehydratase family protein [Phytoactinopolyspora mesophila]